MKYQSELLDLQSVEDLNCKFYIIHLNYSRSICNIDDELYYKVRYISSVKHEPYYGLINLIEDLYI